jgi:membrane-associated phospholipid phosphatase
MAWRTELGARVRWHFLLKTFGTTMFVCLFLLAYFQVQLNPSYPPTVMPLTDLDLLISFQPYALIAYVSLFVYVGVGPGLQKTWTDILAYCLTIGSLCAVGLAIFYFLPTQLPAVGVDESSFFAFALLHQIDAASNACPSMHVAIAIFTAMRVHAVLAEAGAPLWLRLLNGLWCALIAYSTLAIKQHVVLDVAGGLVLGAGFGALVEPVRKRLFARPYRLIAHS